MVMAFFRRGTSSGFENIETRAVGMLGDARHSFDMATTALLSGSLSESVAEDIRATDQRINQAEQDLRSELVVHVSVQGAGDIGSVLGMMLMLKKIERIGDQAKNILDLAEDGISLLDESAIDELHSDRLTVSAMFAEAAELLTDPESGDAEGFVERAKALSHVHQEKINGFMYSDRPGREVVPLAIYFRYLKRIVANLLGVVGTAIEPLPHIDYLDDGETDITDD